MSLFFSGANSSSFFGSYFNTPSNSNPVHSERPLGPSEGLFPAMSPTKQYAHQEQPPQKVSDIIYGYKLYERSFV